MERDKIGEKINRSKIKQPNNQLQRALEFQYSQINKIRHSVTITRRVRTLQSNRTQEISIRQSQARREVKTSLEFKICRKLSSQANCQYNSLKHNSISPIQILKKSRSTKPKKTKLTTGKRLRKR